MKHSTLISIFLMAIVHGYSQNINLAIASPQPIIQEVYGGSIVSGDLDNDGDIDIVQSGIGEDLMGLSARASVFLNDGNGNFTLLEQNFNNFGTTENIILSDFDNDDDLDLVITAENRSDIYLNDGQANFVLNNSMALEPIAFSDATVGDVDGDGDNDVIQFGEPSSSQFPPIANLFLNNGSGTFSLSPSNVFVPLQQVKVEFVDLEGDGDLDVLSFGENENNEPQVGVYQNDGFGNFSIFSNSNIAAHQSDEISVGDVDNDGDEDVLITGLATSAEPKTILYLNNGEGQFSELSDTSFPDIFGGTNALSDLDNDGDLDITLIGAMNGGIPNIFSIVFENLGNNVFVAADSLGGEYIAENTIADFNGDGKKDIIIQGFVDDTNIYWNETLISSVNEISRGSISVFPNPTQGQFQIQSNNRDFNKIEILDQQGRLMFSKLVGERDLLDFSFNAPEGIYILKMSGEKGLSTQKIVLSK